MKVKIKDTKTDIDEVSKKLRVLNKNNLTDTYALEDLQDEYDRLIAL